MATTVIRVQALAATAHIGVQDLPSVRRGSRLPGASALQAADYFRQPGSVLASREIALHVLDAAEREHIAIADGAVEFDFSGVEVLSAEAAAELQAAYPDAHTRGACPPVRRGWVEGMALL